MDKIKYPRTMHLPRSPGATADDRIVDKSVLQEVASEPMVVTEKMDGTCARMQVGGTETTSPLTVSELGDQN